VLAMGEHRGRVGDDLDLHRWHKADPRGSPFHDES
jgi:hypothetical protein